MSRRQALSEHDSRTLAVYLRDIAKLPRLSIDEERELGVRIQRDHDEAAVWRLVEANLRFVVSCARRYRGFGVPFLDLIHEGNLGLVEAARRFDPSRNVKFITYGVWWVRQAIASVLADHTRAFSFPPKLLATLNAGAATADVSLDAVPADGGRPLGDTLPQAQVPLPDVAMLRRAAVEDLSRALADLDRREREVVRLRFGFVDDEPWTLQAIGERLHLTRERVRQIEARAKDKLRRSARLRSHLN